MSDLIFKIRETIKHPKCYLWGHDFSNSKEICRCGFGLWMGTKYSWTGLDLREKLNKLRIKLKFWEKPPF